MSGTDLISRQGLLNALNKYRIEKMSEGKDVSLVWECIDKVLQEPSAQPKPFTDNEQRIFLAAMAREEKVCREADRNYARKPYVDSLVWICKEIRRKVKGALWET